MPNWKSYLNSDPTDWLLQDNNPSVRYYTLKDILGKSDRNSEVKAAKESIMQTGVVPRILAKQRKGGTWADPNKYYNGKYKGTVWTLMILAEHGADGNDNRIKNASEFIFKLSQDRKSGGFSYQGSEKNGGQPSGVIPCLTGNMVWSFIRFGYLNDPRVKKGIDWITKYQRFDDGIAKAPKGGIYNTHLGCFGKHTCHMGAAKALKALAEVPVAKRTKALKNTIEVGVEYFLKHNIFKRSHDLKKVSKPGWIRYGFPLMYQTDILELLGIISRLGYKDERMQEAADRVVARQDEQGRWLLLSTFNGRFQTNIERKGKPSKWVTLHALKALKAYYGN